MNLFYAQYCYTMTDLTLLLLRRSHYRRALLVLCTMCLAANFTVSNRPRGMGGDSHEPAPMKTKANTQGLA